MIERYSPTGYIRRATVRAFKISLRNCTKDCSSLSNETRNISFVTTNFVISWNWIPADSLIIVPFPSFFLRPCSDFWRVGGTKEKVFKSKSERGLRLINFVDLHFNSCQRIEPGAYVCALHACKPRSILLYNVAGANRFDTSVWITWLVDRPRIE